MIERDVDKSRGHQQEGSVQTGGTQTNHDNGGQYKPKKKFKGNWYNCKKRGYIVKNYWSKKKHEESDAIIFNQMKDNDNEWEVEALIAIKEEELALTVIIPS